MVIAPWYLPWLPIAAAGDAPEGVVRTVAGLRNLWIAPHDEDDQPIAAYIVGRHGVAMIGSICGIRCERCDGFDITPGIAAIRGLDGMNDVAATHRPGEDDVIIAIRASEGKATQQVEAGVGSVEVVPWRKRKRMRFPAVVAIQSLLDQGSSTQIGRCRQQG